MFSDKVGARGRGFIPLEFSHQMLLHPSPMESWTNCPLAPIIVIKKAKRNKLGLMMKTAIIVFIRIGESDISAIYGSWGGVSRDFVILSRDWPSLGWQVC